MLNNTILCGRLIRDPELRYLPGGGQAITKFNLAVDRKLSKEKKQEAEAKGYPTADFINITAWGKQAEFVANYLGKGNRAIVQGSIQTGSYVDKDGKKVYTTEIRANEVTPIDWKESGPQATSNYSNNNFNQQPAQDSMGAWNNVASDDDDIPF